MYIYTHVSTDYKCHQTVVDSSYNSLKTQQLVTGCSYKKLELSSLSFNIVRWCITKMANDTCDVKGHPYEF